jgi:hypothetical protein
MFCAIEYKVCLFVFLSLRQMGCVCGRQSVVVQGQKFHLIRQVGEGYIVYFSLVILNYLKASRVNKTVGKSPMNSYYI